MAADRPTRIGVLALQGSFAEHVTMLKRIDGVQAFEVRTKEELQSADGLIIPGGESTTMALAAERWGLIPELKQFAEQHRPVWGTCAGAIFLAEKATGIHSWPASTDFAIAQHNIACWQGSFAMHHYSYFSDYLHATRY